MIIYACALWLIPPTVAAPLIYLALRGTLRWQSGLQLLGAVAALLVVGLAVWNYARSSSLNSLLALEIAAPATLSAIVAGLVLLWKLPGRRKLAALLLIVVFPIALYLSLAAGEAQAGLQTSPAPGIVSPTPTHPT